MNTENIQVAGCAICQDRKEEIVPNVKQMYPYIDYFVLVNGGNKDGWVEEVKALDTDNKIHIIDFPWCDNFPASRSKYIEMAGKFRNPEKELWLCRFDSDEYISVSTLEKIKTFILYAKQERRDMIGIRCIGNTLNKQGEVIHSTLDDFWKGLIYKWFDGLKYVPAGYGSTVHETYNRQFNMWQLPSMEQKYGLDSCYHYKHVKMQGDVWERAQRNFFIGGGGPNYGEVQPLWKPFRNLLNEIGLNPKDYHDYINYLKKGNIDQRLKNWIITMMFEGVREKPEEWKSYLIKHDINNRDSSFLSAAEQKFGLDYDGASEVRESYKVYFRWYHEEEEPEELKHLSIP